jgi:hypothetical protein
LHIRYFHQDQCFFGPAVSEPDVGFWPLTWPPDPVRRRSNPVQSNGSRQRCIKLPQGCRETRQVFDLIEIILILSRNNPEPRGFTAVNGGKNNRGIGRRCASASGLKQI